MTRAVSILLSAVALADAQFGMDQMPMKPKPAPLKDDLKYIKCETCKKMVHEVVRRAALFSSVNAVEELLEKVCDADLDGKEGRGDDGLWLSELDVSKQGQALVLQHKGPGYCRRECRTIAKACDAVMEKLEPDEVAQAVFGVVPRMATDEELEASVGTAAQRVCTKMAGVCKKGKVPLYPEGKVRKNEEFKPKDKKDSDMENLLASMKGMPGGDQLTMMSPGDMDLGSDHVDEIDVLKDEV